MCHLQEALEEWQSTWKNTAHTYTHIQTEQADTYGIRLTLDWIEELQEYMLYIISSPLRKKRKKNTPQLIQVLLLQIYVPYCLLQSHFDFKSSFKILVLLRIALFLGIIESFLQ